MWLGPGARYGDFRRAPSARSSTSGAVALCGDRRTEALASGCAWRQTRLRFGGRQPLWACGVTSWMEPTSRPVAWSDRIAVSRPEPGPLTKTSTFFMPCSCARRAAASAASCAANGVDLRDPLKPTWPEEAQAITAPEGSVMEMMVLLNVLLMCAWPWEMFFFSLRRGLRAPAERVLGGICFFFSWSEGGCPRGVTARGGRASGAGCFRPAFFFPGAGGLGALPGRAVVFVGWPRPRG